MGPETHESYEFGPFVLDTVQHILLKEQKPVPLAPKAYDALLFLVQNRGRMLLKDELMKALWPDSFVQESNLTVQISTIRRALGIAPGENRYIVTVPGRGYRFAAPVTVHSQGEPGLMLEPSASRATEAAKMPDKAETPIGGNGWAQVTSTVAETAATPGTAPRRGAGFPTARRWLNTLFAQQAARPRENRRATNVPKMRPAKTAALTLLSVALVALGYFLHRWESVRVQARGTQRSLAILPFHDLKRNADNDFLGLSLADAVITKLGYVRGLTVRPSSAIEKYRTMSIDIRKVAADLNVDTLVLGNFVQDGDELRITFQLIDVKTVRILWTGGLDLKHPKLLTVQDKVARMVIKGLSSEAIVFGS